MADDGRKVVGVRPEYYGMLLFSLMGPGRLLNVLQPNAAFSLSAYALAGQRRSCVMLVNKEPFVTVDVKIMPGRTIRTAESVTLSAPALSSVSGVKLNGASIGSDGVWAPAPSVKASLSDGVVSVAAGPASATLVTMT